MAAKIPIIYLVIYKIFITKSNGRIYLSYEDIREIMRRRLHKFCKTVHLETLKEMEELQLIKRIGNTKNIVYELIGKGAEKKINQLKFPI